MKTEKRKYIECVLSIGDLKDMIKRIKIERKGSLNGDATTKIFIFRTSEDYDDLIHYHDHIQR